MADRKRYSKTREERLYAVVDKALTDLRIKVLKGALSGLSCSGHEEVIYVQTKTLADQVCAEYRKSYTKAKE